MTDPTPIVIPGDWNNWYNWVNPFSSLTTNNKTIGIFTKVSNLPSNAIEWDRALIIWDNTYRFDWTNWIDMWSFVLPIWEQGMPWKDGKNWIDWINWIDGINWKNGKNWKDGIDWVDGKNWLDWQNGKDWKSGKDWANWYDGKDWLQWIQWENWKDGKDWNDWERWMDGRNWIDWKDVNEDNVINRCINILTTNQDFINRVSGKDWKDWERGMDWTNWKWDRLFVWYSSDWQMFHLGKEEWDKFISFEVNNNWKNIFQIVS